MATFNARICIRRGLASEFTSANPTLALGEIAYETDTRNIKVGDGATAWTALGYINPYRGGTAAAPTSNTVLGSGAGAALGSGATSNVAIGQNALANNTAADSCVAIGVNALLNNQSSSNVAVGPNALSGNNLGGENTAIGGSALAGNSNGSNNVAVGQAALNQHTGSRATAVGHAALLLNTASDITAVGANALDANTTGERNTAVGKDALGSNTTAADSTAVGYLALSQATIGQNCTAVGANALRSSTGVRNTAVGAYALGSTTSGQANSAVGDGAGYENTTTSNNVFVGYDAGRLVSGGAANSTPSSSIYIGNNTLAPANGQSNQIVIGNAAVGNGSNTTTIGNSSTTGTFIPAGNLSVQSGIVEAIQTAGNGSQKGIFARNSTQSVAVALVPAAGNDGSSFVGTTTNHQLQIRTNTTTRMTVGTDGNVSIANGNLVMSTAGTGIDFSAHSNAAGMTSELLSDYEEGTWTPQYVASTTGYTTPPTMNIQNARYTKVGRQVTVVGHIYTDSSNNAGGTGQLRISGLPFAAPSGNAGNTAGCLSLVRNFAANQFPAAIEVLASELRLMKRAASNTELNVCDASDLLTSGAASNQIVFSCTYFT